MFHRRDHFEGVIRLDVNALRSTRLPSPGVRRSTVLVIEDHHEVRNVLCRALRRAELVVVEAETAASAREQLQSRPVDAVITDIALRGSVNGVELGNWIRARHPRMPMVYMTGMIAGDITDAPVPDAYTRFVCKPFGGRLLVEHVRSLLDAA